MIASARALPIPGSASSSDFEAALISSRVVAGFAAVLGAVAGFATTGAAAAGFPGAVVGEAV